MAKVLQALDAAGLAGQVAVALGKEPAELVIRGARLVNVFTQEVEPAGAVAVSRGRIASLGPELEGWVGPETRVVEADGLYLLPGLIDSHTHLDGMFSLTAYTLPALASGNTTAVSECGMIAGAWGMAGVEALLGEAAAQPLRLFWTAPPLVPPFPALEDSAGLGFDDFARLMARPDFLGVGEAYWPAVTDRRPEVMQRLALARELDKTQEGHAAGAHREKLMAYAAAGISSCHESITGEEALARLRLGLAVQVRQGFVRKEMDQVVPALRDAPETGLVMLATDVADPAEMLADGVMNPLMAKAVELGVAPARAVAWCSLTPARHFGLAGVDGVGGLAPGWAADMVLVEDLVRFRARRVFLGGVEAARDGELLLEPRPYDFPPAVLATMRCPEIKPSDLGLAAPPGAGPTARARVCAMAGDTITKEVEADLPVKDGLVQADPTAGVLKLAHINRHRDDLEMQIGFTSNWGFTTGALATTLEWDTTNLIVVGADDQAMAQAANRVRELGGGIVLVDGGEVRAELPFPIAGVISPETMSGLVARMDALTAALRDIGCVRERPLLAIQTVCFTGLPFLKLTNKGLVDVRTRAFKEVLL